MWPTPADFEDENDAGTDCDCPGCVEAEDFFDGFYDDDDDDDALDEDCDCSCGCGCSYR